MGASTCDRLPECAADLDPAVPGRRDAGRFPDGREVELAARQREAWGKAGVYLLNGPSTGQGVRDRVYIGEGDDVRSRVDAHLKSKEFWTGVVAFSSKDESLNKAHVRYLEARLLQVAAAADRVDLDNQTAPPSPPLSEADRADADGFLREMLPILPLLRRFRLRGRPDASDRRRGAAAQGQGRRRDRC